jgi:hypothetical protein
MTIIGTEATIVIVDRTASGVTAFAAASGFENALAADEEALEF